MTTALIDGDVVAFRAAAGSGVTAAWDADAPVTTYDPRVTSRVAVEMVEAWTRAAGCDDAVVAFSSPGLYRKQIAPSYKAARGTKPDTYYAAVDAISAAYPVVSIARLEADDVLGILATNGEHADPIVVSIDKDLQQIPGRLYDPVKGLKPRRVSLAKADYYWFQQALTGDPTDGYKGCPGIGQVRARRLLDAEVERVRAAMPGTTPTTTHFWDVVKAAFAAKGLTAQDALVQVRLARILRADDYNPHREEIRLWHPTKVVWLSLV